MKTLNNIKVQVLIYYGRIELNLTLNEFKFKIVKKLNEWYDAYNYEALLHEKFNVMEHKSFINRSNEAKIDRTKYNKIFTVYYMENGVIKSSKLSYQEMIERKLGGLTNKAKTSNGYYLDKNTCEYYNRNMKIYSYNIDKECIVKHNLIFKDIHLLIEENKHKFKDQGRNMVKMFNKQRDSAFGFYNNREICEFDYTKYIIYTYENGIIVHNKLYRCELIEFERIRKDNKTGESNILKVAYNKTKYSNGMYNSLELIKDHYTLITLYNIDGTSITIPKIKISKLGITYNDKFKSKLGWYMYKIDRDYQIEKFSCINFEGKIIHTTRNRISKDIDW